MISADRLLEIVLLICMFVLCINIFLCVLRGILGPRFTDRLVAVNEVSTNAIIFICVLSVYLKSTSLVDVALVYGMIDFVSVVVATHVITLHHKGRQLHQKEVKK